MKRTHLLLWILFSPITLLLLNSGQVRSEIKNTIINGENASQTAYPFMTALISSATNAIGPISPFCGASFIGGRYVLTASHCLENMKADEVDVVIGAYDLTNQAEGSRYKVNQIYLNENYDTFTIDNDIAIIELTEEVNNVAEVKLLSPGMEETLLTGDTLKVMGWGSLSVDGTSFPTILQEVDLALVDSAKCNAAYGGTITESMLCAGLAEGGKDSCQGDSGGPLLVKQNNEWYQVGVVSYGATCAVANIPGVYARVPKFINWVKQKKSGFSYTQTSHQGYVEQNYNGIVKLTFNNLSDTGFLIEQVEFSDLDNISQASLLTNNCNSVSIETGGECELAIAVATSGLGEASFIVKSNTNHPDNPLLTQTVLLNALEPTKMNLERILDINNDAITWFSGGDAQWVEQTSKVVQGSSAIASGDITDDQNSVLLAVIDSEKAHSLSFHYFVQAELGYDGLKLLNNGQDINFFATGINQAVFKKYNVALSKGVNRISFIFKKDTDDVLPVGLNKAYIDLVQNTVTNTAPTIQLSQKNYEVEVAKTIVLDASETTDLESDAIEYTWSLSDDLEGVELEDSNSEKVNFTASETVGVVGFTVTARDSYGAESSESGQVTIIASTSTSTQGSSTQNSSQTTTNTVSSQSKQGSGGGSVFFLLLLLCPSVVRIINPSPLGACINK
jgi:secreted trypsin-like serine protease